MGWDTPLDTDLATTLFSSRAVSYFASSGCPEQGVWKLGKSSSHFACLGTKEDLSDAPIAGPLASMSRP